MVAHPSVKDFLLNKDLNTKRAGWITKAMEYDIKIKVTKLVRGRGLCEQLVELVETKNNDSSEDLDAILAQIDRGQPAIMNIQSDWIDDMVNFL